VSGLVVGAMLVVAAVAWAAAKPGKYTGTTSEHGTVSFTVAAGGKSVKAFSASDGYNGKCHFSGGAGGLGNFSLAVPSMKVARNGTFTTKKNVKLGPFSATIVVKGKVTGGKATGTLNKVGAGSTCGSGSSNPATQDYLETFTATRA
jgi:hypothetical protein